MVESMQHLDWNKWKEVIEAELASLYKREVFSGCNDYPS
jgi:hypothetical protein